MKLSFLVFVISIFSFGVCEECVTFNFENDFDSLFGNDFGMCVTVTATGVWTTGNYSSLMVPPDERSSTYITPTPSNTMSCTSSFEFLVAPGGVFEVNLYMLPAANTDQVNVIVSQIIAEGDEVTITVMNLMAALPTFTAGWNTLTATLGGTGTDSFTVYMTFMGQAAADSIVLVDSFRYIPPGLSETEQSECVIYRDSDSEEDTSTDTSQEVENSNESNEEVEEVEESNESDNQEPTESEEDGEDTEDSNESNITTESTVSNESDDQEATESEENSQATEDSNEIVDSNESNDQEATESEENSQNIENSTESNNTSETENSNESDDQEVTESEENSQELENSTESNNTDEAVDSNESDDQEVTESEENSQETENSAESNNTDEAVDSNESDDQVVTESEENSQDTENSTESNNTNETENSNESDDQEVTESEENSQETENSTESNNTDEAVDSNESDDQETVDSEEDSQDTEDSTDSNNTDELIDSTEEEDSNESDDQEATESEESSENETNESSETDESNSEEDNSTLTPITIPTPTIPGELVTTESYESTTDSGGLNSDSVEDSGEYFTEAPLIEDDKVTSFWNAFTIAMVVTLSLIVLGFLSYCCFQYGKTKSMDKTPLFDIDIDLPPTPTMVPRVTKVYPEPNFMYDK